MRILKESARRSPRLSLILLDWGVRESFHLLHYLRDQTVGRDVFEVILIEYYGGVSEPARKFESEIDAWILLEMPAHCYYHKHLMYNAGIAFSKGQVLMFGDSDAMVRPRFVETILTNFERDPQIVYHMDEFRNVRRDFYPFNYPSFEDVLGDGCINNAGGKTTGVLDVVDPMHSRNYGACMCAWRKDILEIGGADEDLTYLGHICGPYDMTFRLMNSGRRLVWETDEYLYHTWHPGSDGIDNYLGPHDGKNMSTTAFQALNSGRVRPFVENEAIHRLRVGGGAASEFADVLIDPKYADSFDRTRLGNPVQRPVQPAQDRPLFASYRGFDFYRIGGSVYAAQPHLDPRSVAWDEDERVIKGASFNEIRDIIDKYDARYIETAGSCNIYAVAKRFAVVPHVVGNGDFRLRSYRENPGIVWLESFGAARKIAELMNIPVPVAGEHAGKQLQQIVAQDLAAVTVRVEELQKRLGDVEQGVAGIYNSRTWTAITKVAGFIQRLLGGKQS